MNAQPNTGQLWPFTLHDQQKLLDSEDFPTLHEALCRASGALWADRLWLITSPDGRLAASRRRNTDGD